MNALSPFDPRVFAPRTRPARLRDAGLARVTDVAWADVRQPPTRARGVKRLGLLYEQRVADVLSAIYGTAFVRSPGIRYRVRGEAAAAIPDGVLRIGEQIYIIEVKLRHTEVVWEQLMGRYLPLVRALEPQRHPRAVEICRSYDPAVMLPGPHTLVTSLHASRSERSELEVLQWKI